MPIHMSGRDFPVCKLNCALVETSPGGRIPAGRSADAKRHAVVAVIIVARKLSKRV